MRFVGTILKNQISKIPGQPCFLCEKGPFLFPRLEIWQFWGIGLFHKAIFGIFRYNFEKSDCKDTWSPLFLCKKGPFFCFLWLSWWKGKDKWDFGKKFEKFLQSQRAGLLKRAMKALKRVGLGPCRQVYFGKRRLKMKENRRLWLD